MFWTDIRWWRFLCLACVWHVFGICLACVWHVFGMCLAWCKWPPNGLSLVVVCKIRIIPPHVKYSYCTHDHRGLPMLVVRYTVYQMIFPTLLPILSPRCAMVKDHGMRNTVIQPWTWESALAIVIPHVSLLIIMVLWPSLNEWPVSIPQKKESRKISQKEWSLAALPAFLGFIIYSNVPFKKASGPKAQIDREANRSCRLERLEPYNGAVTN